MLTHDNIASPISGVFFIAVDCLGLSLPGPPVEVGMNIDISSIDMVSEVNMVSTQLSPLPWMVSGHPDLIMPAMHTSTEGNPYHPSPWENTGYPSQRNACQNMFF